MKNTYMYRRRRFFVLRQVQKCLATACAREHVEFHSETAADNHVDSASEFSRHPESGGVRKVMEEVTASKWRPNLRRASLLFLVHSSVSD